MATKKRAPTARRGATKKRTTKRTQPGRYRGMYVRARRDAVTRSKKKIDEGQLLLAVEDAIGDWVPVLYRGQVELVPAAAVTRLTRRK